MFNDWIKPRAGRAISYRFVGASYGHIKIVWLMVNKQLCRFDAFKCTEISILLLFFNILDKDIGLPYLQDGRVSLDFDRRLRKLKIKGVHINSLLDRRLIAPEIARGLP